MKLVLQIAIGIVVGTFALSVLNSVMARQERLDLQERRSRTFKEFAAKCDDYSLSQEERNQNCEWMMKNAADSLMESN